jgi:prolyl-tRNA editing enzyme YbaK/EbsC (Cys-tRNA(Pro) deacylase)
MDPDEIERVDRVRGALRALGETTEILVIEGSTHTAAMAAAAAGCELGQIVKTLAIYVAGVPRLALVSGDRRLDDRLVAAHFGVGRKQVKLANADQVLALTGYPVGGVSPFALPQPLEILLDDGLHRFATVWVAGGSASAIFPIHLENLARFVGGTFASIGT